MSKQINRPPTYCKNAVASAMGWSDPKTGELLISNKSLNLDDIEEKYPNQVKRPVVKEIVEDEMDDIIPFNQDDVLFTDLEIDDESVELIKQELDNNIIDELVKQAEAEPLVFEEELISENLDSSTDVETPEISEKELTEAVKEVIDYISMTKAELVSHAQDVYGVTLNKKHNKDTLIEEIEALSEK